MERPIASFRLDSFGDPVAMLSCGHLQHVRHRPPFFPLPWVLTEEGRKTKIGIPLNCVRCDSFEFPEDFVPFKKTPTFDQETLPKALRHDHSTAKGIWAKIRIQSGRLLYAVPSLGLRTELTPTVPGIILPEVLHSVQPLGPVCFLVEFFRQDPDFARREQAVQGPEPQR